LKKQGLGLIFVNRRPLFFFIRSNPKVFFFPNCRNRLKYRYTCKQELNIENFIPQRMESKSKILNFTNRVDLKSLELNFREELDTVIPPLTTNSYTINFQQNLNYKELFKDRVDNNLSFFYTVVPLRDVFCWEVGLSQMQKGIKKKRELLSGNWNFSDFDLFPKTNEKWYACLLIKSKKIWLKTFWIPFENRETLYRNSFNWRESFKKYWNDYQRKKIFSIHSSISKVSRKFRLNTHENKPEVKFSNSFFLFSFKKYNSKKFKLKIWKRGLPFSKISFIPRVERNTFQKRIKINRKIHSFPNVTNAERFIQGPISLNIPIFWISDLSFIENISETRLIFQESIRLFEKNKLRGSQINPYLFNPIKRDRIELIRREARWRIKSNQRWKSQPFISIYYRPYYRVQPSELLIGRRFHTFQRNYDFVFQKDLLSFLVNSLTNKWKKRKSLSSFSKENRKFIRLKFSSKYGAFHNFQISIHLNLNVFKQFSRLNTKSHWRRWQISNLPVLAKARKNWLEICDKHFTTDVRRCVFSRKSISYMPWWRLIGPILVEFPKRNYSHNQFWQYSTTFFPKYETNFFILMKDKKFSLSRLFSFSLLKLNSDHRTYSFTWIKKVQKFFSSDYTVWVRQDVYSIILLPFTFFLFFRIQNFLSSSFNSVKKDFSCALYQIVKRGGGAEIESEWIEWLLNAVGLSQQNAGIRIYQRTPRNKGKIEKIIGFDKEISIFFNILFYLRICKWNWKFSYLKKKYIKFWFGGFRPVPILIVGPPGTGKTIMVRSLGTEADVPVIYQCLGMFTDFTAFGFGRTVASKAIQLGFREAWCQVPAIFFLDEIDRLGMNRRNLNFKSNKIGYIEPNFCKRTKLNKKMNIPKFIRNDKKKSSDQILGLSQLLVEIDRRIRNDGLVLIRATNLPGKLDSALIRPGRFHHTVFFNVPNKKKREILLKTSLASFLGTNNVSIKSKRWNNFLIKIKGKSPAYLVSLRNLAFLHRRNVRIYVSVERRFERVLNRIEGKIDTKKKTSLQSLTYYQGKKVYYIIKLKNFLEIEYINRIVFFTKKQNIKMFWKKNFFVPGKKFFFTLFLKKNTSLYFSYSLFFVKSVLQIVANTRIIEKRKQNLYLMKGKTISYKRNIVPVFSSRKIRKEELVKFSNYIWFLIQECEDYKKWRGQWYHFEISEFANFHTFSWIPPDDHIIEKLVDLSFKNFNSFNVSNNFYQYNLKRDFGIILFHQSRRKLDLIVSNLLVNF
jgi:hypothetical protein